MTPSLAPLASFVALAVAGYVLYRILAPFVRRWLDCAPLSAAPGSPTDPAGDDAPAWLSVPPGATLRRTERVQIGQRVAPTPVHRADGIAAVARWYDAPGRFTEIAAWYAERLAAEGWAAEPGSGATRVFRRDDVLLWLADGEDPAIWQRLVARSVLPALTAAPANDLAPPAFTVLVYRAAGVKPLGGGDDSPFRWLGKI